MWPGRAKAEFKAATVDQSSKSGQQGKFWADRHGPVLVSLDLSAAGTQWTQGYSKRTALTRMIVVRSLDANGPDAWPRMGTLNSCMSHSTRGLFAITLPQYQPS